MRGCVLSATYLSLFSGIGGLDLAVESSGFTCVGQVEFDPACSAVLERWWPDVPRWGGVHDFTAAAYTDERLKHVDAAIRPGRGEFGLGPDLICGGYPCQPFSHAGKRGGTSDPRHLWPEFARIIGEFRPRWVLLENVPGHLALGGTAVVAELASLGYDATWLTLRASDIGAPHRRERWFCLGVAQDYAAILDGTGSPGVATNSSHDGQQRARDAGTTGTSRRRSASGEAADASNVDELAGPQGSPCEGRPGAMDEPRTLQRVERSSGFPWGAYAPAIERWERVMGPAPHPVDDKGRLAPPFVEWMQGFPAGWTDQMTRTQALKALGNAVVPQQGAAALAALTDTQEDAK